MSITFCIDKTCFPRPIHILEYQHVLKQCEEECEENQAIFQEHISYQNSVIQVVK